MVSKPVHVLQGVGVNRKSRPTFEELYGDDVSLQPAAADLVRTRIRYMPPIVNQKNDISTLLTQTVLRINGSLPIM